MLRTIEKKILLPLILAGFMLCALHRPVWATQIIVNGGVGIGPGYLESEPNGLGSNYIDITQSQSSLAGSASLGGGSLGFAASSGDLATGELRAFIQTAPAFIRDEIFLIGGTNIGSANVQMDETIHIGGALSDPLTGFLVVDLEGSLLANSAAESLFSGIPTAWASFQFSVNNDPGPIHLYSYQTTGCPPEVIVGNQSCVNTSQFDTEIRIPFLISDSLRDFSILASASANSSAGGIANISNTASLRIELPTGLSFTSDSGVFLSQVGATPVPEPATMVLFGSGLVGLAVLRRRT